VAFLGDVLEYNKEVHTGRRRAIILTGISICLLIPFFLLFIYLILNPSLADYNIYGFISALVLVIAIPVSFTAAFAIPDILYYHFIIIKEDNIILKTIFGRTRSIRYSEMADVNTFKELRPGMFFFGNVHVLRIDLERTGRAHVKLLCNDLTELERERLARFITNKMRISIPNQ
jgi:hypothetical protein